MSYVCLRWQIKFHATRCLLFCTVMIHRESFDTPDACASAFVKVLAC